jgi:hypothetical protein
MTSDRAADGRAKPPAGAPPRGRILRLKQGYNPNSSSIGTIVFALPAALLGATAAFGVAASLIVSALARGKEHKAPPAEKPAPADPAG